MSDHDDDLTDFERRLRASLRESVDELDGATRSRLTRARHAALDEAQRRRATVDVPVLAGAAAGGGGWPTWLAARRCCRPAPPLPRCSPSCSC